ncbi:hypothetical protein GCM10009716_42740 [Streptomyces sodiiphilus]|uniref:Uncharacterized protein n=1 Tax=Streptomyces sodiiphilus TaxID=226217 RepID=A0ABN2PS77_9ACTN
MACRAVGAGARRGPGDAGRLPDPSAARGEWGRGTSGPLDTGHSGPTHAYSIESPARRARTGRTDGRTATCREHNPRPGQRPDARTDIIPPTGIQPLNGQDAPNYAGFAEER